MLNFWWHDIVMIGIDVFVSDFVQIINITIIPISLFQNDGKPRVEKKYYAVLAIILQAIGIFIGGVIIIDVVIAIVVIVIIIVVVIIIVLILII